MKPKNERVTRLDYCQYLLVSQINYTLTNYAEQTEKFSHDMANRYLSGAEVRPRLVWDSEASGYKVRLFKHHTDFWFLMTRSLTRTFRTTLSGSDDKASTAPRRRG